MKRKRILVIGLCLVLVVCVFFAYLLSMGTGKDDGSYTEMPEIDIPVSQPVQTPSLGGDTGSGSQGLSEGVPSDNTQGAPGSIPDGSGQGGSGYTETDDLTTPSSGGNTTEPVSGDDSEGSVDIVVTENGDILLPELP